MKTIAVVSGGMDSVTLAHHLHDEGHELHIASVDYGQRHSRELAFARACAYRLGVPFTLIDLTALRPILAGSALTSDVPVPEGHYADETMRATVVPNRNAILISVATGLAISVGAQAVAVGVHAGDHPVYPDCRPEFIAAMEKALRLATKGFVADDAVLWLRAPFVQMSKADIVTLGDRLNVPWTETWSCYAGGDLHCGRCGTDVERREAFSLAGVVDPTKYEAVSV